MPRLFCALNLPAPLTRELSELKGALNGARWIEQQDYHITLHFFGDMGRHQANDLVLALDGLKHHAFEVKIDRLDVFGGDRPRSLHAAIAQTPALMELQAAIERIARQLKLKTERRKYSPHITLARLKDTLPVEAAGFIAARGGFQSAPFEVEAFDLFSSKDSIGGGPYISEARFKLQKFDASQYA